MILYELAYTLGIPVYQIQLDMPYDEFIKWSIYFDHRPIGWREDQRTYYTLAAAGVEKKATELFASLAKMSNENKKTIGSSFSNSSFFSMAQNAKGGDRIKEK